MITEFDLVKQDLARERGERQRLSLENSQLKQQLAALRKDKTEVVEPETDIRIQFIEKDLLIHRLQEEIQNRGSTKACPEVVIPRRIEVEDNCDIEMLNLEMPDDCLPALIADKLEGQRVTCPSCVEPDGTQILRNLRICEDHLKAKHNKELLEMSNEELELAIKNEAFCTDCFQSSHRMCKGEMPNLLDLKKHSKGRKMLEYLETLNAEGRVSKMTAKRSIAVTKEDLIAKVKEMMKTDVKTPVVDASVTQLAKKIQDFTKTVLDLEGNIDSVWRKMVEISATPS